MSVNVAREGSGVAVQSLIKLSASDRGIFGFKELY